MNVLITFLSFAEDVFGGIENSIFNLAVGLQRSGAGVAVYTSSLGSRDESVSGVAAIRNDLLLPAALPVSNADRDRAITRHLRSQGIEIAEDLARVVEANRIDVVLACDPLWGIVQICEAWNVYRRPTVLSFHVLNDDRLLEATVRSPYLFYRAVSHDLARKLNDRVRLPDVEVIPNSIDLRRFSPRAAWDPASKILFCNSRIDPGKGIPYLLRAFARFSARIGGFELWLCAGHSPFGDRSVAIDVVEKEIRELGIGRSVRMLDNLRWRDVPDYIRRAFAVVLPSLYESFGRGALEALACGVPIIASRVGNLPSLIGDAGILVEPASDDAIYEALLRLYEKPKLGMGFHVQGPAQAIEYDSGAVAATLLAAIERRL